MGPTGRGRLRLPTLGARLTVEITVVMAAALLVLPVFDKHMSDAPVSAFMVAIGLCAVRFGFAAASVPGWAAARSRRCGICSGRTTPVG